MESTRNKEEDRFAVFLGSKDTPAERRRRDEKLDERLTDIKTEMNGLL